MAKTRISIRDIYRFKLVTDPRISPSGAETAFVVETMNRKEKKYYSHLYLKSMHGATRQLTFGKKNDLSPRWSPDGSKIAFISKREETGQIWILPMDGGEAHPLTSLPRGGVSAISWSPDGKTGNGLLFSFTQRGRKYPSIKTESRKHRSIVILKIFFSAWTVTAGGTVKIHTSGWRIPVPVKRPNW
ncbi:MAG: TolB family protein [Fidelibacterota bacterium]